VEERTKTSSQKLAVFSRQEVRDKLGIDLDNFFMVSIERDGPKQELVFYRTKD
jgi:hypothetical protein